MRDFMNAFEGVEHASWPRQISPADLVRWMAENHHTEEDLSDGDLNDRVWQFQSYQLQRVPLSSLNLTQFNVFDDMVDDYETQLHLSEAPPIVYDPVNGSIIDGTHRANAAKASGRKDVLAYVGDANTYEEISEGLVESVDQTVYYHGSRDPLPAGTILRAPRSSYVNGGGLDHIERESHDRCEAILEHHRPSNAPARVQAVFLVLDPEEIDYAGGYNDHVYVVEPLSPPWKANLNWYSALYLLCEDEDIDDEEAAVLARNYWTAQPKSDSDLMEFLVTSAKVGNEI